MLTQLNPQLQQRLSLSMPEIATFYQRWHITELSLFGSVLGNQFHSVRSPFLSLLLYQIPKKKPINLSIYTSKLDLLKEIAQT